MPCQTCHNRHVIKSWGSAATRRFAKDGKGRFAGLDREKAKARLQLLDSVISIEEIPPLVSVGLHKLKGDRRRQWALTINGPWRMAFEFRDGDAYNVEIVDYHRG